MHPALFKPDRALLCFHIANGAWVEINPQNVWQAIAMQTPTIGGLRTYCGDKAAIQCLAEILTQAGLLLNVGKNLRPEQVYPVSQMILSNPDYKIFTVADFRLAIIRGVQGKYGSTYDRYDITVICNWLDQYFIEKTTEAEEHSYARRVNCKEEEKIPVLDKDGNPLPYKGAPEWFSEYVKQKAKKHGVDQPERKLEADKFILEQWRKDWNLLPDNDSRPTFEGYCTLKKAILEKHVK